MEHSLVDRKRKVVDELFTMVDDYVFKTIPDSINDVKLTISVESRPCQLMPDFEVCVVVSAANAKFHGDKMGVAITAYASADADIDDLRYRQPEIERTIDTLLISYTKNLIYEMNKWRK